MKKLQCSCSTRKYNHMATAAPAMLDALYSILNVEHAALLGSQFPAAKGINIKYHFNKVRKAIKKADPDSDFV